MIRLFIALSLDLNVKNSLSNIIIDLKSKGGKVKWVEPLNLHLTVKFLGNTDPGKIDSIKNCIDRVGSSSSPIETSFTSLGGFPNLIQPKVIWVDMDKNKESLTELASKIDMGLTDIGFEKDNKPFKPHLTLGRVKDSADLDNLVSYLKQFKFEKINFCFDTLQLIQSTLTQKGPIYKTLHEVKLADRFSD